MVKNIQFTIIIFCYIFSFYIVGPITSSMVVGVFLMCPFFLYKEYKKIDAYSLHVLFFLLFIIFTCLFYSTIHLTFDFSYMKTMFGQLVNIIFGICMAIVLRERYRLNALDIEKYIVWAFLIQSIIQLIASATPSLASVLLYFNRAEELQDMTGRRGVALSSGTGWSLALAYGLMYIIYVKRYLLDGISTSKIMIGVFLLLGTMFAGRTGFVGAAFAALLFFANSNKGLGYKCSIIINVLLFIGICCILFYILFPSLTTHLIENVFPFAFEPFYRLFYNDEFSTKSTDRLLEMWEVSISPSEVLLGTGYFMDPIREIYYKGVDIGILRNLFYWGIVGYLIMMAYQCYLLNPIKNGFADKKQKWNMQVYYFSMLLYLFLMEFKAMAIGFNKITVSIVFLLGYFYYYDYKERKKSTYIYNHPVL